MSAATTERPTGAKLALLVTSDAARKIIAPFLPEGADIERIGAAVRLAADTNPALLDCKPQSLVMAVARIQSWGLEIGTTAHLVPYGKVVTPQADYKGLVELAVSSGAVRFVHAREVREGDAFSFSFGLHPELEHRPTAKNGAPITHAWCILDLPFNRQAFDVMTAAEIDEVRQRYSKQWKPGPLTYWYARKTVIRRTLKAVPKNPKMAKLFAVLHQDAMAESPEIAKELGLEYGEVKSLNPGTPDEPDFGNAPSIDDLQLEIEGDRA